MAQASSSVLSKLIEKKQESIQKALKLASSTEGWEDQGEKDGVRVSRRADGPRYMMRGSGKVAASMAEIRDALALVDGPSKWDKSFISNEVGEELTDSEGVKHMILKSKWASPNTWVVSNRSFVHWSFLATLPDGKVVSVFEIAEHPKYPADIDSGFVRGESYAFYVVSPLSENEQEMTYCVSLDPKGSVPTMIVNQVASEQPMNVRNMANYIKSKKQTK